LGSKDPVALYADIDLVANGNKPFHLIGGVVQVDCRLAEPVLGAPVSLLGIAVLHAALITLVGHSEQLQASGVDFRLGNCNELANLCWFSVKWKVGALR
jgi:hypothetical protein